MPVSDEIRKQIKEDFRNGDLKVQSVDPETNEVSSEAVSDVMKHHTPRRKIVRVKTEFGDAVSCTVDHSLFRYEDGSIQEVEAGLLHRNQKLAYVEDGEVRGAKITSVISMPYQEHTYDLSVPGNENFVLTNGLVAHNSYSIGGVSLSIEKSSKYESLKSNAEGQFKEMLNDGKTRTEKYIKGLKQSRYGVGVRSSFGPVTGKGVLTPRKYLGVSI